MVKMDGEGKLVSEKSEKFYKKDTILEKYQAKRAEKKLGLGKVSTRHSSKADKQRTSSAGVPSSSANTKQLYSSSVEWESVLVTFRNEFNRVWDTNSPSPETGLQDLEELAVLGAGAFGKVLLVKETFNPKQYYAVKMMYKDEIVKTKQVAHVHSEKKVLQTVNFTFLLHLEFARKDNDCVYLGLPFVNGGELFTYQRKVRKFTERQAKFYASQVLLGLEYMHNVQLIYRDLKPENILLDSKGYIRITDFGFTKRVTSRTLTLCGTPEYLAPEIIKSRPYGNSVDYWAFGILIYEFVAGFSPFAENSREVMVMYEKICECKYKMPSAFSHELSDLINNLLQVDTSKRYGNINNGVQDIKEHDWFKTINWISILNQEVTAPYMPTIKNMEDLSNFTNMGTLKPVVPSRRNKHEELFEEF